MTSRLLKPLTMLLAALFLSVGASAAPGILGPKGGNMLLQADEVIYTVDKKTVTARGHVEIDYNGRTLHADTVSYDQAADTVTASGNVSVQSPNGDVVFANHVTLTDKMRDGVLEGFAALIGKTGRLVAASGRRMGGNVTEADQAAYTPCKICRQTGQKNPLWQVKAKRVVYDQLKHKIRFNDATLELFGVPVIYLPYYEQPDPTVKHASGVLAPVVGASTTIGSFIKLPVYVALSDSQDLTLEPWFTTYNGEVVEGEYRQRFDNGGFWLQGSIAHNPNGGLNGDEAQNYAHVFGSGSFALSPVWRTGFDIQLASSDTYLKRYEISYDDRLVSDLFLEGESGRSRFAITGYFFQGLRATDNQSTIPVALPLIEYTYIPLHDVFGGQFRFDLNTVALTRQDATSALPRNDQRGSAELRYRLPFTTDDGEMFALQADVRGDLYHIDTALPFASTDKFISRALPYVALDWRWPFIAAAGDKTSVVLEPIVQAIAAPYGGNPPGLPNEDSTAFEFSDENLFSFDRLPGYDLAETGPRANVGVRGEVFFPTGSIETLLGQSFRPKSDPIFGTTTGLSGTISDLIARFDVKFAPYIDLTHRIDINEQSGTVRRNEVYLTSIFGRTSTRISYILLPPEEVAPGFDTRQEVNAQTIVGLFDHWSTLAAADYDLQGGNLLDTEFGVGYEDECLSVSLAYRRRFTRDRDVIPSTSVILRFTLKTGDETVQPFDLFPSDVFAFPHS